jgi:uncharacterized ferritin-like protein (DUF455 family)
MKRTKKELKARYKNMKDFVHDVRKVNRKRSKEIRLLNEDLNDFDKTIGDLTGEKLTLEAECDRLAKENANLIQGLHNQILEGNRLKAIIDAYLPPAVKQSTE